MKSVNFLLTIVILAFVMLEVLLVLVVMAMLVVLVKMAAILVVLVMMAVLDVMVATGSSCLTNMTTTPMRVPNATKTNKATPIIMNLPHFTVQLASALFSSPSWVGEGPAVQMALQTGIRMTAASARGAIHP